MGTRASTKVRPHAGTATSAVAGTTADLFESVPVVAQAGLPAPRQLWLALRLPLLPLEAAWPGDAAVAACAGAAAAARSGASTRPRAVAEGGGAQRHVVICDERAARGGLRPGLRLGAAYALVPDLDVRERNPALELRHLQALGRWATRYTPFVSLEPPDTLLLEVRGSLRLFGGATALAARAGRELDARAWRNVVALAPTPRAATWLARAAPGTLVETQALLASRLGALGFGCTGWPEGVHEALVRLGVRTLGELRRLPRDGLARRFDPWMLRELDEAFGLVPTPRRRHASPERFQERLELAAESGRLEQLEPAFDRLLERMGRFLRVRNAGVERLVVAFAHRGAQSTRLALGRATPCGEAAEWRLLLRERLGRETLRAPVLAVALRTSVAVPLESASGVLPGLARGRTPAGARADAWTLLDRLRARLGEHAVNGVCLVPEHRPEAAWRRVQPRPAGAERGGYAGPGEGERATSGAHALAPRPLWLLAEPQRLRVLQGQPCCDGMLRFESGPERIESGWWDGQDVRRDYYVVVTREGARLWIYRDIGAHARGAPGAQVESRWFLHGLFG